MNRINIGVITELLNIEYSQNKEIIKQNNQIIDLLQKIYGNLQNKEIIDILNKIYEKIKII